MNKKRQRASRKNRRFCPNATTTRQTNGLQDEKVIYDTEEEAWAAITAKTRNAVLTMESLTPYLCRPTADHYHIGRRIKHDRHRKGPPDGHAANPAGSLQGTQERLTALTPPADAATPPAPAPRSPRTHFPRSNRFRHRPGPAGAAPTSTARTRPSHDPPGSTAIPRR